MLEDCPRHEGAERASWLASLVQAGSLRHPASAQATRAETTHRKDTADTAGLTKALFGGHGGGTLGGEHTGHQSRLPASRYQRHE